MSFPSPRLVSSQRLKNLVCPTISPITGGRIIGFIPFAKVLVQCEMLSVSSGIWTRVSVSISCDDNHYTTGTSTEIERYSVTGIRTSCSVHQSLSHRDFAYFTLRNVWCLSAKSRSYWLGFKIHRWRKNVTWWIYSLIHWKYDCHRVHHVNHSGLTTDKIKLLVRSPKSFFFHVCIK